MIDKEFEVIANNQGLDPQQPKTERPEVARVSLPAELLQNSS
jgi:hypothetical protein